MIALARAVLAGVLFAGCTVAPAGPPIEVPNVGGTWMGTWGGTPLTLLVTEQRDDAGSGGAGIYVGTWQVLGGRTVGLTGVMTYTGREGVLSVNVQGRFAMIDGHLALIVDAPTPEGAQQLVLDRIEANEMTGSGTSKFSWGPQGPVELKR